MTTPDVTRIIESAQDTAVATMNDIYSGQVSATAARRIADAVLTTVWPAIEAHVLERAAELAGEFAEAGADADAVETALRRCAATAREQAERIGE